MAGPAEQISPAAQIYSPLSASQDEFRLIELLPASEFKAPIVCYLIHSNLRSPLKYEALSYVWGCPPFTASIKLDASPTFAIGKNLELALRYLRFPNEKRVLWVDALCIDQADRDERSQQVGRMRDIFLLCESVLVYLGPYYSYPKIERSIMYFNGVPPSWRRAEASESDKEKAMAEDLEKLTFGLTLMEKISDKDISSLKYMNGSISELNIRELTDALVSSGQLKDPAEGYLLISRQERTALHSVFFSSPIWDRVWIVQELSCARQAVLVGGTATLGWDKVSSFLGDTAYADAFHSSFGHGTVLKLTSDIFSNAATFNHQRGIFRDMGNGYISTLFDVLARFRKTQASDERDKIYGLLGLVSEKHSINPDYNKTYQQVFTEAAISIINSSGNLDILCQSPWSDNLNPGASAIPSWVPDFTYEGHEVRLFAQRGIYSAGAASCRTPCWVTEDGVLSLPGIMLGQIGPFPASLDDDTDNFSGLKNCRKWMLQYFGDDLLSPASPAYITGESSLQAYWCTLLASCTFSPIKRLTPSQISEFEKTFTPVLRGEEAAYSLSKAPYYSMLERMLENWMFAMTTNGLYLMIQSQGDHVRDGDLIVVLHGAKVPVVLRRIENNKYADEIVKYKLVSTAYVHGFMDGEASRWVDDGKLKEKEFLLV